MALPAWHRRLDLVYLTFFIIHIPVMFGKSCHQPDPSHRSTLPPPPSAPSKTLEATPLLSLLDQRIHFLLSFYQPSSIPCPNISRTKSRRSLPPLPAIPPTSIPDGYPLVVHRYVQGPILHGAAARLVLDVYGDGSGVACAD